MPTWIIGSGIDCDLIVDQPTVSRRHCRLSRLDSGDFLEDLGSSNGTFVNGVQIRSSVRVNRGDTITLGATVPMPWPDAPPVAQVYPRTLPILEFDHTSIVIGRNADCDHVIDLPMVSGRHARLIPKADRIIVEDLGSSNGTFVNGQRIDRETYIADGDTISLGSHAMTLSVRPRSSAAPVTPELNSKASANPPLVSAHGSPSLAASPTTWNNPARVGLLIALVAHALALALVIVIIPFANASDLLFWVSLAAVWLGISTSVLVSQLELPRVHDPSISQRLSPPLAPRLLVVIIGAIESLLFWAVIELSAGLAAPAIPTLGIIVLATFVGLTFGSSVVSLVSNPPARWAVVSATIALLWFFGRGPNSREWLPSWTGIVSNAAPTRWAFEGLLLLEDNAHAAKSPSTESTGQTVHQLAESLFPIESDRMGPRADALALGAMLVGLLCATAFISYDSKVRRKTS